MNKYILPGIFLLIAIILSLCLTGFTLLKDSFLPPKPESLAFCGTPDLNPSVGLVSYSPEQTEMRERGEKLFNSNCTTCHSITRKLIGPALQNICAKYSDEEGRKWLSDWIRDSPKMIFIDKDPRAIALWEEYNRAAMNSFPSFTDQDIADILEYIQPGCFEN